MHNVASTTPPAYSHQPKGYYVVLPGNGEKVLAMSTTAAGHVFFTTYRPNDGSSTFSCAPSVGMARLYTLIPGGYGNTIVESSDLDQTGIPPQPILLYPPPIIDDEDDDAAAVVEPKSEGQVIT